MTNYLAANMPSPAYYGRSPGGAEKARDDAWSQQENNDQDQANAWSGQNYANTQAQTPRGPQANENAYLSNQQASGANGHQQGAMGLARGMAMGQSPTEAAYQLQAGLDMGSQMQSSLGNSARGGAALATGQQNAMDNTSNLQQNAFSQAGALRAREMAQGRGLYGTLTGQAREQDAARLGIANEFGQGNAARNDKYSLDMGQAGIGFADLSNQQAEQDLAYYKMGMNPVNAQSDAWQQYQSWLANAKKTQVAQNAQED